jgi:peroxiredoxin
VAGAGIAVGSAAPAFALPNQHGTPVALSDFEGGKDVVLVFFPFAFSSVCSAELTEIRDRSDQIVDARTEVLAISCDHRYSLRTYAERDALPFSLLSDFWPHGAVSRAYGAFDDRLGCSTRTTVIVDRAGLVRWAVTRPMGEARDFDAYLTVLADLHNHYGE